MQAVELNIFKAQKEPYSFQMTLKQIDSERFVALQLTHNISHQKYYLQINQKTIEGIQGLSKYYQTPTQLFQQLQLIVNQIRIDDYGAINFELMIGKSKQRKITLKTQKVNQKNQVQQLHSINQEVRVLKKLFYQQTHKIQLEQQKLAKLLKQLQSIVQFKNDVAQQRREIEGLRTDITIVRYNLEQKNTQNLHLGEAVSVLSLDIKQLKNENQKLKSEAKIGQNQLQAIRQQLAQAKQRISSVQQNVSNLDKQKEKHEVLIKQYLQKQQKKQQVQIKQKKQEGQIKQEQIKQQAQKQEQKVAELKQEQCQGEQITQINCLKGYRQHQHNARFTISKPNDSRFRLSLTGAAEDQFISFIHTFRAFKRRIVLIKMSIEQSAQSKIFLGVCTKNLLNQTDIWRRSECVCLNLQTSNVVKGGNVLIEGGKKIEPKKIVEMEVDLLNQQITWRISQPLGQPKIIKLDYLPNRLQRQQLFLHISMCNNEDVVDVITD